MLDAAQESEGRAVAADAQLGLRIAMPILSAGLALEVAAHALGTWGPEASVALASLLLTAPFALLWQRRTPRVEHAHSGIAFVVAIVIANGLAHAAVGSIAGQEIFLSFGIIATGAFVLSRAWLVPMLAVQFATWLMLIGVRGQLVVMPITLTMLSVAIHLARRRAIHTAHSRQAELEIANAKLRLAQNALDCAGDPILWIKKDGAISYANRAASQLLGYTTDEIIQMQIGQIDQRPSAAAGGPPDLDGVRAETRYHGKDGSLHPVEVQSRQVEVNGRPFSCVIARDLSERLRIEEKLRLAQRMESLGALAGGLAHDFNNLLVGITGNADLAREAVAADSPARPLLDEILAAGDRATRLTTQLLAYAGGSLIDRQKLEIGSEIREIAHLLETSLPKGVPLEIELERDLPSILADRAQLQQIALNLVVNAGEAIGQAPGVVHLRTLARELSAAEASRLEPSLDREGGTYVGFEVSDDGCGIDDETRGHLFDPFYTTREHGRGLGLAAVLGITRRHGGGVEVESKPHQGSTFRVLLPALSTAEAARTRASVADPRGSGLALVVDDEPAVRAVACAHLESFGYTTLEIADGPAAVETVRDRGDDLRLVLLDLTMPGMDGRETLRRIREICPWLPVVLSSGYEAEPEAIPRPNHAPISFLRKPYHREDLARALHALSTHPDATD